MNSAQDLYGIYSPLPPLTFKPEPTTPSDTEKENSSQCGHPGERYHTKDQGLSERSSNMTDQQYDVSNLIEAIEKMQDYQQYCIKNFYLKEAQETKEKLSS